MNYLLLVFMILRVSFSFAQNQTGTFQLGTRSANLMNMRMLFARTFEEFKTPNQVQKTVQWVEKETQKTYKASLVGVNINGQFENLNYVNDLQKIAEEFPITDLLQNLQANNPALKFNNPELVQKLLKADIYSPYLSVISEERRPKLPILFSDITRVVSYDKEFNIYGFAAGDMPYFGRPIPGRFFNIDLGIIAGQMKEVSTRLPDTDIFLVAMVNLIPNWLEEGFDIYQRNLQELEILVYAFDREGSLLGGSGLPLTFKENKIKYTVSQRVISKVWQPIVASSFVFYSSLQIANTPVLGSKLMESSIPRTINKDPHLNGTQKYILSVLQQRLLAKQGVDKTIFDTRGRRIINLTPLKNKKNKVVLADRFPQLVTEAPVAFDLLNIPFFREDLFVRTKSLTDNDLPFDYEPKIKDSDYRSTRNTNKVTTKKRAYPSNEGAKLSDLFNTGEKALRAELYHKTKAIDITNNAPTYQLEQHPSRYKRGQKNYGFLAQSYKVYLKNAKKDLLDELKKESAIIKDKIFWYKLLAKQSNDTNLAILIKQLESAWKKFAPMNKKVTLEEGIIQSYFDVLSDLGELKKRNQDIYELLYIKNSTKKIKKLDELDRLESKIRVDLQENVIELKARQMKNKLTDTKFTKLKMQVERLDHQILAKANGTIYNFGEVIQKEDNFQEIIPEIQKNTGINAKIIQDALGTKIYSPLMKKEITLLKKERRVEEKAARSIYYEGYSLGLSGSFTIKSQLNRRLKEI